MSTVVPPTYEQVSKLTGAEVGTAGLFGSAVAVSRDGTTALVSSLVVTERSSEARDVYVLSRSDGSWSQQAVLPPGGADETDTLFGTGLALSGDGTTAVVGAFDVDVDDGDIEGAAYVFEESGGAWSQQARLVPLEEIPREDLFGLSVAVSDDGTTAAVNGAAVETPDNDATDVVTVFEAANGSWRQTATLLPDIGETGFFGYATTISSDGTTLVLGAPEVDQTDGGTDSVYVFSRSGDAWTREARLVPDDAGPFGNSVGVSGDGTTAVVSAPPAGDAAGQGDGSAYVFSRANGSWERQARLAPGADSNGGFGWQVGLSDDGTTALVSDPRTDRGGGSVAVFSRTDGVWRRSAVLVPDDGAEDHIFGWAVALSVDANTVVVGAVDPDFETTGSVYIFQG